MGVSIAGLIMKQCLEDGLLTFRSIWQATKDQMLNVGFLFFLASAMKDHV
jgi:hypothetical protein